MVYSQVGLFYSTFSSLMSYFYCTHSSIVLYEICDITENGVPLFYSWFMSYCITLAQFDVQYAHLLLYSAE